MNLLLEADELFNIVFKITYYDEPEFAVCNQPFVELTSEQTPVEHANLLSKLGSLTSVKSKINVVVNNILLH